MVRVPLPGATYTFDDGVVYVFTEGVGWVESVPRVGQEKITVHPTGFKYTDSTGKLVAEVSLACTCGWASTDWFWEDENRAMARRATEHFLDVHYPGSGRASPPEELTRLWQEGGWAAVANWTPPDDVD